MNPSDLLTDEQKAQIAEQRAQQFAAEAYSHELNKAALLAADPDADTSAEDAALDQLSKAVASVVAATSELTLPDDAVLAKAREQKQGQSG